MWGGMWAPAPFRAVGATNAPIFVFMSLCIGTQTGIGILAAQHYGAGDKKGVASVIRNGAYVLLAEALFMTLLAMFLTEPLLKLLGTPPQLLADAGRIYEDLSGGPCVHLPLLRRLNVLRAPGKFPRTHGGDRVFKPFERGP